MLRGIVRDQTLDCILSIYKQHLEIYARLEEIADSLPGKVDPKLCWELVVKLRFLVTPLHNFEEEILYPIILERSLQPEKMMETLGRLSAEHWSDRGFGDEIIELLANLADPKSKVDAERAGYMLRGFFEGVRRHIMFEIDCLIPQIAETLTIQDKNKICQRLRPYRKMVEAACPCPRDIKVRN